MAMTGQPLLKRPRKVGRTPLLSSRCMEPDCYRTGLFGHKDRPGLFCSAHATLMQTESGHEYFEVVKDPSRLPPSDLDG